jgi:hypothetical protein
MVHDADSVELVPAPAQHPSTLFRTDDPLEVVARATRVADTLKSVLNAKGMVQQIQGREHVKVEGWQTLGSMCGVVPVVAWTRKLEDGWEARVEARTLDGRVVGAAEAMCTRAEKLWKTRDEYALRSMAQTRATSKALRAPLGFVVTLAGYDPTPAEEMPHDAPEAPQTARAPYQLPDGLFASIAAELKSAGAAATPAVQVWLDQHGAPPADRFSRRIRQLPVPIAEELLAFLRYEPAVK